MIIAGRRRLAVAAVTAAAAALMVPLLPTAASAAPITAVSPQGAANTDTSKTLTFTTTTPFLPGATQVDLVRSDTVGTAGEDVISGTNVSGVGTTITATFAFASGGVLSNPGSYDVFVYTGQRSSGDSCVKCFGLVGSDPTVRTSNVPYLAAGKGGASYEVDGTSFARGAVLQALLPGTAAVDPAVTFGPVLVDGDGNPVTPATATVTTSSRITRTIAVSAGAAPGPRDLRVSNSDGRTAVLANGLHVTDLTVTSGGPPVGNTRREVLPLTGTGFPANPTVTLTNETTPTVTTALAVVRQSPTALAATVDLTGATPGEYRVGVASSTGDRTTPECSATLTVVDTRGGTPGAVRIRATDFTCTSTTGPSPSAAASPSASPSASPTGGTPSATPTVSVTPGTIQAGTRMQATVRGTALAGSTLDLYAYSRPSTAYARVRTTTVGADGTYSFTVRPSGNTRLFARATVLGRTYDSTSTVLLVQTGVNLKVTRTGVRTYRFTGSTLPVKAGQVVTVYYRGAGSRVIASKTRVLSNGHYDVTRTFRGTGTFDLFTATGTDVNNVGGTSTNVRTTIR